MRSLILLVAAAPFCWDCFNSTKVEKRVTYSDFVFLCLFFRVRLRYLRPRNNTSNKKEE